MVEYDEDFLDEISNEVNLLEYIETSIDLKQRGKDYFGTCPLHLDETPSFSVNPEKNYFYCFSCGRGGGIIQYLNQYENLPINKAIEKASRLASIDISKMCSSQTVKINKKIKKEKQRTTLTPYVHEKLNKSQYEKDYLQVPIPEWEEEGIKKEVLDLFEVRVNPRDNRIIYPVYDTDDNFINIKGRTKYKDYKKLGIPKYINYKPVGVMDYFQGLNITRKNILDSKEILIFESIKSVMKLYGHGVKNAVSAEKHDLTNEQIRWILKQDIRNVVLCYDSDITYKENSVKKNINTLKRMVNLYVVKDRDKLLGGSQAKNSPIDCGFEIWEKLYQQKKRIL